MLKSYSLSSQKIFYQKKNSSRTNLCSGLLLGDNRRREQRRRRSRAEHWARVAAATYLRRAAIHWTSRRDLRESLNAVRALFLSKKIDKGEHTTSYVPGNKPSSFSYRSSLHWENRRAHARLLRWLAACGAWTRSERAAWRDPARTNSSGSRSSRSSSRLRRWGDHRRCSNSSGRRFTWCHDGLERDHWWEHGRLGLGLAVVGPRNVLFIVVLSQFNRQIHNYELVVVRQMDNDITLACTSGVTGTASWLSLDEAVGARFVRSAAEHTGT